MHMEFPHLNDTNFPGLDNEETFSGVDVYKYQNDFDYYRWRNQVSVKLLNVLWNSNYADVPYFNNDSLRDEWFDSQDGIIQPLTTPFNSTPETNIQLPIPYNDAYKYNYVVVDMPIQTSEEQPLDYENKNIRVKRWYYFIEDIEQLSPNTTRFIITLDYWTTFIHSVEINYLMLERGHAPLALTDVDTYLNNPIENSEYLLADDFNYQRGESIIKASNFTPIGNGKKYVLFAAPYAKADFDNFGGVNYSGNSTPPSYDNQNSRWGYQLTVNDYEWKYGSVNYSNANLPIRGLLGQDNLVFNGNYVYAIEANEASAFFNIMAHNRVNFIRGIQAIFILDENMFNRGDAFTYENYTLYQCTKNTYAQNFVFDKNAFEFETEYKELAKLYTSPYSFIEITDDAGNSFTINIENCGRIQMHREVSLAYPFLKYNIFFSGINGNGQFNYTWKNLNDANINKTMWESDFSKFMMNWDIPTYSIYVSGSAEYAADNNAGKMQNDRLRAIKDYQNATRFANTNRENMADSMATNTANVAASGVTSNTNQTIENNASKNVTGYTANDDKGQIGSPALQNRTEGTNRRINTANRLTNVEITSENINKIANDYTQDNRLTFYTTQINNEYASLSGAVNSGVTVAHGVNNVVTNAAAGAIKAPSKDPATLAASGGIAATSTIIDAGLNAFAIAANTYIGMSNAEDITALVVDVNSKKYQNASDAMRNINEHSRDNTKTVMELSNEALRYATNTSTTAAAEITTNTVNTNNANAERTQDTETDNATYTRNANIAANKANLVQAQRDAEASYKASRLSRPVLQGNYSATNDLQDIWQRRGIRLNIRTQTKAAIKQAGDGFLRFGYALHRVWDMKNGFNYMKYFTFWKAEDIWINDGSGVANIATNTISDILLKGVTVWKDPTKIGMVSIYENTKGGE